MKKSKIIAVAGLALLTSGLLAACSGSKSNSAETKFGYVYSGDPETLDYVTSGKATTSDLVTNGVDGLLENDKYGNLVPSMAKSWTVSKDGLTYTYKLRKGAKWYTSEGEEYAEVKAQDFVTGLKHAADKKSEALYLVQNSIKGLDAYVNGQTKDFSTVGVKAVDDYTVQYTLNKPEPYWNSKTTSAIMWPINAEFLKSKGNKFGQSTDPNSILYNGPFLMKAITAKSAVEYVKNKHYWDKDKVNVDSIKLAYYDGQDQDSLARNFKDGAYTYARLFPASSNFSTFEKDFKDNIYTSEAGAGTAVLGLNIDRQTYNHTAKKTDEEKNSTKKALLNKDFRQAITFAFDRTAYASQVNGKDGATKMLRNLFVPPTFVQTDDKSFGELVKEKLVGYDESWKDVNLNDAQDGLYNPTKAKEKLAKAKAALQADGVQFPIHLDYIVSQVDNSMVQQASSFKQSVESALGADNVVVDLQKVSDDDFQNITYFSDTAAARDYDISGGGWAPDYQDPSTYLESISPVNGSVFYYLGIDAGSNNPAIATVGLDQYANMLKDADAELLDQAKRYEKYAAAQAWLTDSSITLPTVSNGGAPMLQRTVPYSRAASWVGTKGTGTFYKYLEMSKDVVTTKDFNKAKEEWLKKKAESNKKAQEDLKDHIEKKK